MSDLGGSEIKAGRDFDSYSCQNPALPLLFLKKHCFIFPLLQAKLSIQGEPFPLYSSKIGATRKTGGSNRGYKPPLLARA